MAVGAASRSWRERLERLDRGLTWAVGLIQIGVLAYVIWGPSGPSEAVATLIALAAMGILGLGTLYQVWHFRRWTLTGPALVLTWIGLAAIEAWPLLDPGTQAPTSLYVLWQMGATFVLWSILTWRLIYRDAGLSHLVLTLTLMAWSLAIANLIVGGPAHLLLLLVSERSSGRIWWLNSLLSGLMCLVPLAPITTLGWLLWRVGREWSGSGPL
jgi:hypothetical protein